MYSIETHSRFDKNFKKRIKPNTKLLRKFQERVYLFAKDPRNPILKDHQLIGVKSNFRSFWITGNYRVIYQRISKNNVIFMDIGTHPQIY